MVTLEKIQEAKKYIGDSIRKTPVLNCPKLGAQIGNDVYFKLENLQQTGSFKLRGALNKRSEEHTSELQSRQYLVCCLLLEKNNYMLTATVNSIGEDYDGLL